MPKMSRKDQVAKLMAEKRKKGGKAPKKSRRGFASLER